MPTTTIKIHTIRKSGLLRLEVCADGEPLAHFFPCKQGREVQIPEGETVDGAAWAHSFIWKAPAPGDERVLGDRLTAAQLQLLINLVPTICSVPVADTTSTAPSAITLEM